MNLFIGGSNWFCCCQHHSFAIVLVQMPAGVCVIHGVWAITSYNPTLKIWNYPFYYWALRVVLQRFNNCFLQLSPLKETKLNIIYECGIWSGHRAFCLWRGRIRTLRIFSCLFGPLPITFLHYVCMLMNWNIRSWKHI